MDALEKYFHPGLIEEAQKQNPFLRLNDLVYSIIEKAIIYGGLPPGTRLSIVKIASLLNVSRTPVSDALELLQKERLVVSPPSRKGHYVFDISHSSLEQLFMARKALEGTAACICARQNGTVDMPRLRSLAIRFQRTFEKREFTNFSELDQDFHNQIIHSCRNPYILKMYAAMERFISYYSIRSQEYMSTLDNDPNFAVLSCQHMAIYRAIALGMPELAETASKTHLDTCYNLCMRYHTIAGNLD